MSGFPHHSERLGRSCRWLVFFSLAVAGSSCSVISPQPASPRAEVKSLQLLDTGADKTIVVEVLQSQVMRFADNYAATVAQAADELSTEVTDTAARLTLMRWKLSQATAAYVTATGHNPVLNALDLVVLASVSRMVVEDELSQTFGEPGRRLLETHRRLEQTAWESVDRVLKPDQQQEFRNLIQEWRQKNPRLRYVGASRILELAVALGKTPSRKTTGPTSLLGLLYLDPLAGLDPTAAAIQETRQMAERAMYYGQRMPTLLNWQTQLLAMQLSALPETKQLLSTTEQLNQSVATFAKVADQLPKLVNDQREAAIKQLFDGLAVERTNWLASVAAEEKKFRELLADTRQTLQAGTEMAAAVNTAVQSVEALVRPVNQPTGSPATADVPRQPFDVRDYSEAANRIGAAAKELTGLVNAANQSTTLAANLSRQATADAERFLQLAFWLGLLLIVILLVGAVLAGLTYRVLANRWRTPDKTAGR